MHLCQAVLCFVQDIESFTNFEADFIYYVFALQSFCGEWNAWKGCFRNLIEFWVIDTSITVISQLGVWQF